MVAARGHRAASALAFGAAIAWTAAACTVEQPTEAPRPTPTPGPPSVRSSSTGGTFDGRVWDVSVIVETKGEPTDVVIEWGTGTKIGPFDHVIPMAEDVIDSGRISIQTTKLPLSGEAFCTRFTATNSFGSASTPGHCFPGLPSGWPPPASP